MSIKSDIKKALGDQAAALVACSEDHGKTALAFHRCVEISEFSHLDLEIAYDGQAHPYASLECCIPGVFAPNHYGIDIENIDDMIKSIAESCRAYLEECADRAAKDLLAGYRP